LHVLLEMEAYPSRETDEQMARDLDLAQLALGVLPDAALIVLQPRGRKQASGRTQHSAMNWSVRKHRWRVLELWKVPAEELLGLDEVGLVPFVPLGKSRESPRVLLERCRERIERQSRPQQRSTLLTITSIMAGLRYTDVGEWFEFFGGKVMLAESPLYQLWMAEKERETRQDDIVRVLKARLGPVPEETAAIVKSVADLEKLDRALTHAARCRDLDDFRKRIARG
jgi:hypothetical protein